MGWEQWWWLEGWGGFRGKLHSAVLCTDEVALGPSMTGIIISLPMFCIYSTF